MGTNGQMGGRNNFNRSTQMQKHLHISEHVGDSKCNILAEVKVKVAYNTP